MCISKKAPVPVLWKSFWIIINSNRNNFGDFKHGESGRMAQWQGADRQNHSGGRPGGRTDRCGRLGGLTDRRDHSRGWARGQRRRQNSSGDRHWNGLRNSNPWEQEPPRGQESWEQEPWEQKSSWEQEPWENGGIKEPGSDVGTGTGDPEAGMASVTARNSTTLPVVTELGDV